MKSRHPLLTGFGKPTTCPTGQFALRGEALASIVPAEKVGMLEAEMDRGVHIGRHRTLTQDSEFGIAQVVEIAIRALSPAVNDTFTGVACVDWLADALLTLAERPPLEGNWYDNASQLRVWMPPVRLERLAKLASDGYFRDGCHGPFSHVFSAAPVPARFAAANSWIGLCPCSEPRPAHCRASVRPNTLGARDHGRDLVPLVREQQRC